MIFAQSEERVHRGRRGNINQRHRHEHSPLTPRTPNVLTAGVPAGEEAPFHPTVAISEAGWSVGRLGGSASVLGCKLNQSPKMPPSLEERHVFLPTRRILGFSMAYVLLRARILGADV